MTSIDTVNDLPPRVQYVALAAQTEFDYPFPIFEDADLVVNVDGVDFSLTNDYTVSGEGDDAGGTVTLVDALAGGEIVTIYRDIAIARDTDVDQNGPWRSAVYNDEQDKIFLILQQLEANINRSLRIPITAEAEDSDMELPPSAWANMYLSFDSAGRPLPTALTSTALTAALMTSLLSGSTAEQDAILALLCERSDTSPALTSLKRTAREVSAGVVPTNYAYVSGDIRRYGAVAGGSSSTNRTAIQNALDCNDEIFIPDGNFAISATLLFNSGNVLRFQSRNAIISGNLTSALLAANGASTTRRYRLQLFSGTLDNTSRANAGGIGLDLASTSMAKVFGTEIKNVETGVRCLGYNYGLPDETGCFYNELHGVDILTVVTGVSQGQLANSNKMFGGRINDCTYGTVDNDNTENSYFGVAIESFSSIAHRNSNATVSILTRYIGSRLENYPVGVGTGISIGATAQDTFIEAPYFTGLVADIGDSGLRTSIIGGSERFKISGGSTYKRLTTTTVARDVAIVNAGTRRQEGPFTVTGARVGDFIGVTLPASWPNALDVGPCICTANDTVYFNLNNHTAGNIDPCPSGAENFVFFNPRTV